jgi:hypothetical protein
MDDPAHAFGTTTVSHVALQQSRILCTAPLPCGSILLTEASPQRLEIIRIRGEITHHLFTLA